MFNIMLGVLYLLSMPRVFDVWQVTVYSVTETFFQEEYF